MIGNNSIKCRLVMFNKVSNAIRSKGGIFRTEKMKLESFVVMGQTIILYKYIRNDD